MKPILISIILVIIIIVMIIVMTHRKALSRKNRIRILMDAQKLFIEDMDYYSMGLCYAITSSVRKRYPKIPITMDNVSEFIPEFTRDNVIRLSKIHNFTSPTHDAWWWDIDNKADRIKALNALIYSIENYI